MKIFFHLLISSAMSAVLLSCMANPLGNQLSSEITPGFSPGLTVESPSDENRDRTPPSKPGVPTWSANYLTVLNQSPVLTWTPATDESGGVTYEVALGTSAGDTSISSWKNIGSVLTYRFTSMSLANGIAYYASVRAVDAYGNPGEATTSAKYTTLNDAPSLSLDFSASSTLNPVVRHSRSVSSYAGSYFDSTGTMRTAAVNYILQSETFDNASWTKNATTVSADATLSPGIQTNADQIIESGTTAVHSVSQSVASLTTATSYTLSVYAKYNNQQYLALGFSGTAFTALPYAIFDISSGILETSGNGATAATIVAAGSGWYRISLTAISNAAGAGISSISLRNSNVQANASYLGTSKSAYFWGAQFEAGTSPTSYAYTTTSASALARLDYDPTSCSGGTCSFRGLLIENAKTNQSKYSQTFTNAAWVKSNMSATINTINSPMATLTGNTLTESSDGATPTVHEFTQSSLALTASQKNVVSFYVKPNGRSKIKMTFSRTTSPTFSFTGTYDLVANTATGTGGSSVIAAISKLANGWSRIELSGSNGTGTTGGIVNLQLLDSSGNSSYAGDGTSGIYIWGSQVESGGRATSYIPVAAASAISRSSDSGTIAGATWVNTTGGPGTVYLEGEPGNDENSQFIVVFRICQTGNANNEKFEIQDYNNKPVFAGNKGGTSNYYSNVNYPLAPKVTFKSLIAWELNNTRGASNGLLGALDDSIAIPTLDQINFSGVFWTKKIIYWPNRLNDSQIESFTK